MKYVNVWLFAVCSLHATPASAGFLFSAAPAITINGDAVGDTALVRVTLTNGFNDSALLTLHLEVEGLALGGATIRVGDSTTPVALTREGGNYALPQLSAGVGAVVEVTTQVIAPRVVVRAQLYNHEGSSPLSDVGRAEAAARLPFLTLSTSVPSEPMILDSEIAITVKVAAPAIPFVYKGVVLQATTSGLTVVKASIGGVALATTTSPLPLPDVSFESPAIIELIVKSSAENVGFEVVAQNAQGAALSEKVSATLKSGLPLVALTTDIAAELEQVGATADLRILLTPSKLPHTYRATRLRIQALGFSLGRASIDGVVLQGAGEGYAMPDFLAGMPIEVHIEAQVVERQASIEAALLSAEGVPLSETSSASLASARVTANAGCTANAAPSFAWLFLLVLWQARRHVRRMRERNPALDQSRFLPAFTAQAREVGHVGHDLPGDVQLGRCLQSL